MKVRTLIRLFYKDRKLNRILQIFFTGSGLSVVWLCFLRIGRQRKPRSPSSPPPALQQRGKEPHERLAQSLRKRSPQPFRRNKPPARAQVFVENTTHCRIEILSVNERVDFEVVLETAEIHVRRTHNRQQIIDDKHFGMQEAFGIKVNLHPGSEHIVDERMHGFIDNPGIGTLGQHQLYVNTAQCRRLQQGVQPLGRQEIGRLDADTPSRTGDSRHNTLQQRSPRPQRTAGSELHGR